MKNLIQVKAMIIVGLMVATSLIGCNKSGVETMISVDNDLALIDEIQSSNNKIEVDANTLPTTAIDILSAEYSESATTDVLLAPDLGYELAIRRTEGTQIGELSFVYFNVDGQELSTEEVNGKWKKRNKGKNRNECFELVFPVTFTMADASVIVVESKEGMSAIRDWYEVNPDVEDKPVKTFPLEVIYEDGTIVSVANEEALMALHIDCRSENNNGEGRRGKCFEFEYPISFTMPDGSVLTIESKEGMVAIREWRIAHPDAEERPMLVFPVNITFKDSTSQTVNDIEEMEAIRLECRENAGEGNGGNGNGGQGNGNGGNGSGHGGNGNGGRN